MGQREFDVIVIGGGPSGQNAAIQAAKAGSRVLLVDRGRHAEACSGAASSVPRALRDAALALCKLKRLPGLAQELNLAQAGELGGLLTRREPACAADDAFARGHLTENGVVFWAGSARFRSASEVEVENGEGDRERASARWFVLATGAEPREAAELKPADANVLATDSRLPVSELPASLVVLGAEPLACEYASVFALLGSKVTLVERGRTLLALLDAEIGARYVAAFEALGGTFLPASQVRGLRSSGRGVELTLDGGITLRAEKLLCALGRRASVSGLSLERAGVNMSREEFIAVDGQLRTNVTNIYAVGDAIGPPTFASTGMEQARRAVCHALDIPLRGGHEYAPIGLFTVPEIAAIGLSENEARDKYGTDVLVGRANFGELTQSPASGADGGFLKMLCSQRSGRVLGVHVIGEGASELVHVGQMAMLGGVRYDAFVDTVFNSATGAEAYRLAALDILGRERDR